MAFARQYEFGPFRLDAARGVLFRNGERPALRPKVIEILSVLVEAQGNPVTKDELLQRVWAETVVEEGTLIVRDEPIWRDEIAVSGQDLLGLRNELAGRATRGVLATLDPDSNSARGIPKTQQRASIRALSAQHKHSPRSSSKPHRDEKPGTAGRWRTLERFP